jgi:hypothetical protein
MEYGMPRQWRLGMAIGRLLMTLTGSGIGEAIGVSAGKTTMEGHRRWVDFAFRTEMG